MGNSKEPVETTPDLPSKEEILADLEKIMAFSKLDEAAKDHVKLELISDYMKAHFAPEEIEGVVDWVKRIYEKNIHLYGFMSFLVTSAMEATRAGMERRQGLTVDYAAQNHLITRKVYDYLGRFGSQIPHPEGIDEKLLDQIENVLSNLDERIADTLLLLRDGWPEGSKTVEEVDMPLYDRINHMIEDAVGSAFNNFRDLTRESANDYRELRQALEYQQIENKARRSDYIKTAIIAPAVSIFAACAHSQAFNDGNDVSFASYVIALPIVTLATYCGVRAARYTLRRIFRPKLHKLLKEMRQPLKKYS